MSEGKKQKCCSIITKIVFGHFGVCALVVLYCVFGGFLFEYLEKENEIYICYDMRNDYRNLENKTLHELHDVLNTNDNNSVKFQEIEEMMLSYRDAVVDIGYTGEDCSAYGKPDGPKHEWTFSGSFFFSVTVISTIGYGHISPKTEWGRLTCIAYAVLGIPLVMICLAMIGDTFADVIRYVYYKICCCGFCRSGYPPFVKVKGGSTPEPTTSEKALMTTKTTVWNNSEKQDMFTSLDDEPLVSEIDDPALIHRPEKPRLEPRKPPTIEKSEKPSFNDKPIVPSKLDVFSVDYWRKNKVAHSPTPSPDLTTKADRIQKIKRNGDNSSVKDHDDNIDDEIIGEDNLLSNISIPLTVTLIIVAVYILGGAFLFGYWENWDLLQSSYFCFITLSTIGFGDIVPGTDFEDPKAHLRMLIGAVYMLFGLTILSMAFSLMQEEITAKFKWIGMKLGLVDRSNDE